MNPKSTPEVLHREEGTWWKDNQLQNTPSIRPLEVESLSEEGILLGMRPVLEALMRPWEHEEEDSLVWWERNRTPKAEENQVLLIDWLTPPTASHDLILGWRFIDHHDNDLKRTAKPRQQCLQDKSLNVPARPREHLWRELEVQLTDAPHPNWSSFRRSARKRERTAQTQECRACICHPGLLCVDWWPKISVIHC